jgi:hypothetical protein
MAEDAGWRGGRERGGRRMERDGRRERAGREEGEREGRIEGEGDSGCRERDGRRGSGNSHCGITSACCSSRYFLLLSPSSVCRACIVTCRPDTSKTLDLRSSSISLILSVSSCCSLCGAVSEWEYICV